MDLRKRDACRYPSGPDSTSNEAPEFVPHIDTHEVFRALVADEIRNGRLTPVRRRRIVRYAAGLRMSAVEAGRLIATCREELIESADPIERHHALRLSDPQPERISAPLKISILVVLAIIADLMIVKWLW